VTLSADVVLPGYWSLKPAPGDHHDNWIVSSSPFPASIKGYYPKPWQYNPELLFMTFLETLMHGGIA
jgi:hypothetical protein